MSKEAAKAEKREPVVAADAAAQLPGGTADVAYTAPTATTPAAYVVGVNWDELGQVDPVTYQLRIEI